MAKRSNRPTIVDIAKSVGVSNTTVSRVLRGDLRIGQNTREKVFQTARELNYRPNIMARALVNRGSSLIGFVIRHIQSGFFSEIISGVQNELEKKGYSIILCSSAMSHKDEHDHLKVLVDKQVEGILVTPVSSEGANRKLYADIVKSRIPMVMVTNPKEGLDIPYVKVDNVLGGYLAARHLLELGHRRIAYISPDRDRLFHHKKSLHSENIERYDGFRQALLEYGAKDAFHIAEACNESVNEGTIDEILTCSPRPTAIFAYSDMMAIKAIRLLEARGFEIPKDFSVVGFDDMDIAALVNPGLTTIAQPKEELGARSARLLLGLLDGQVPEALVIAPELIVRCSTAPLN